MVVLKYSIGVVFGKYLVVLSDVGQCCWYYSMWILGI